MTLAAIAELEEKVDNSTSEYGRMLASLELYCPRQLVREWIYKAYHDPLWDWRTSDGCTAVSEVHFPEGFRFPPCVVHDYLWECLKRLKITPMFANKVFFYANRDYGMSVPRASIRWLGVTLSWYSWFKWEKKFNGR